MWRYVYINNVFIYLFYICRWFLQVELIIATAINIIANINISSIKIITNINTNTNINIITNNNITLVSPMASGDFDW